MLSILAPILVFGLVVFVHELGHFLAAKWLGVYAPRFSIGFGPALLRHRRGETEYILAAFPLGGYVRMASRHDEETAFLEGGSESKAARRDDEPGYDPEAMIPFGPKPVPEHRWFESKPLWARVIIMIAGVVMNVVLSIVVLAGLTFNLGRAVVPSTVIGMVDPIPAAPQLAQQLRAGDTIRAVDGSPVTTWNGVLDALEAARGPEVVIATNRGAARLPIGKGGTDPEAIAEAIQYRLPPVLDSVISDMPAARAGLRSGDRIVGVDGSPVQTWSELTRRVSASPGRPVTFVIERGGARRELAITPESTKTADFETGAERTEGRIGALPVDISHRESVGVGEAIAFGWSQTWAMAGQVGGFLKRLVAGELSVRQLGGPVAITTASVSAARSGWASLLQLIAFLSINVAVLNMLPIPILDGGQIVLNVAETVKGSPFSMRTREFILRFGLAAMALLFLIVMYNDLTGLLGRLFD